MVKVAHWDVFLKRHVLEVVVVELLVVFLLLGNFFFGLALPEIHVFRELEGALKEHLLLFLYSLGLLFFLALFIIKRSIFFTLQLLVNDSLLVIELLDFRIVGFDALEMLSEQILQIVALFVLVLPFKQHLLLISVGIFLNDELFLLRRLVLLTGLNRLNISAESCVCGLFLFNGRLIDMLVFSTKQLLLVEVVQHLVWQLLIVLSHFFSCIVLQTQI